MQLLNSCHSYLEIALQQLTSECKINYDHENNSTSYLQQNQTSAESLMTLIKVLLPQIGMREVKVFNTTGIFLHNKLIQ